MIPDHAQISVELDTSCHVETVTLSLLSNTLCVGYRVPRDEIPTVSAHSRWAQSWKNRLSVYVLLNDAKHFAYVGETKDLLKRLNDHAKKEPCEGWSIALAFCDVGGTFLDKGKIKFLEHSAWVAAKNAKTYALMNSTKPEDSHVPDKKAVETFLDYMKALTLPLGTPYLFSSIDKTSPPFFPAPHPLPSPGDGTSGRDFSPAAIFAATISLIGSTLPPSEVAWLQTDNARKELLLGYRTPLLPPLKLDTGHESAFMSAGKPRYFPGSRCLFDYRGKKYRISKEGYARPNGVIPTYDWAIKHGVTDKEIWAQCIELGFTPCSRDKKSPVSTS